ncbi:thermonuclease family protein [Kordiimonas gwangyangensis]|uniref:thermonuclease family protein n=1 Tax=Kordiimonas gwangyangensis TaxID=288022 RepID=UPI00036C3735|nr:thermonuclease family protein [Kordiimonas gwangyangensis]
MRLGVAILFLGVLATPAFGQALDTTTLKPCGETVAGDAIGGARFMSAEGQVIKSALVKAPELWEPGAQYSSWPHAVDAKKALQEKVAGKTVTLYCEGQKTNRLGELVAHVIMPDGGWLALELVREGHVFVFPGATRKQGLSTLYEAEEEAKAAGKGLWKYKNLNTVMADSGQVKPGWFQIVRGTVQDVGIVRGTYYLNFGADWRTDFTIEIPPLVVRQFSQLSIDPESFKGKTLEGRGWIDNKSGPRLLLQGPGQVRVIADAEPQKESQPE